MPSTRCRSGGSPPASRIGSLCFFVGPFPGFVQLVGARADAWVFFIGSLFFTAAAALELVHATARPPAPRRDVVVGGDPVRRHPVLQPQHRRRAALRPVRPAGGPADLGARRVRLRLLPRLGGDRLPRQREAEDDGRRQPRRLRLLRDLGRRLVRRAGYRLDPRPRRRQLEHRARRAVLLRRLPHARPPPPEVRPHDDLHTTGPAEHVDGDDLASTSRSSPRQYGNRFLLRGGARPPAARARHDRAPTRCG